MEYWKVNKRTKRNNYRCSPKHLALIAKIQEHLNTGKSYSFCSTADTLERVIELYYKHLFKEDASTFKS